MSDEWDSGQAPADFKKHRRKQAELGDQSKTDRLPPHSIEAEQGVLGCILLAPNDSIPLCMEKLTGGPESFYDLRHRGIYETLVGMWDNKEPIDVITVRQSLNDLLMLEAVGGLVYISSLPDVIPSAANIEYYLEIVHDKFILRQMISAGMEMVSRAYEQQGDVPKLLDEFEKQALSVSNFAIAGSTAISSKKLAPKALARWQEISELKGQPEGYSTGFPDVDMLTGGLKSEEVFVLAARPSVGKTAFMMNMADHLAVNQKVPVCIFSLEMSGQSLMMRGLCSRAMVSMRDIRMGDVTPEEVGKLTSASSTLAAAPIFIDDSSGLTIMQLRSRARRYAKQFGIKVFMIDYLGLLTSGSRAPNRREEVGFISKGVKTLAKELKVPVVVLAQINRESEKENRPPRLSDLRESGDIEQDADIVGFLYRRLMPDGYQEQPGIVSVDLLAAKCRNAEVGTVEFTFMKRFSKFHSQIQEPPAPTVPHND